MSEGDRWSMPDSGLWIYPDLWWEEVRLYVNGEKVEEGKEPAFSAGFWKAGGGGGPTTVVAAFELIAFILAHGPVYYCFVVYQGERPCLHIELHYIPPRTQSCLSYGLIGICSGSSTTKATCFISHWFGLPGLSTNINNTRFLLLLSFVMSFKVLEIMNHIKTIAIAW